MKKMKLMVAIGLISLTTSPLFAQQKNTDAQVQTDTIIIIRGPEKTIAAIADNISYNDAVEALKSKQFVLEADKVIFRNGYAAYVNTNTNFVMEDNDKSTVQVAFNNGFSGPNGIGGVTVEGMASHNRMQVDKKGNVNYSFSTMGSGLSARIVITLYAGGNNARVDVLPNFSSNTLSLTGKIIPLDQSNFFKGTVSY